MPIVTPFTDLHESTLELPHPATSQEMPYRVVLHSVRPDVYAEKRWWLGMEAQHELPDLLQKWWNLKEELTSYHQFYDKNYREVVADKMRQLHDDHVAVGDKISCYAVNLRVAEKLAVASSDVGTLFPSGVTDLVCGYAQWTRPAYDGVRGDE